VTQVGAGGVRITEWSFSSRFKRQYKKLTKEQQQLCNDKLAELKKDPMPPGLRFEKLQGYRKPSLYTIHLDGNYKLSMEITGTKAHLRNVGPHNEIDRAP